MYLTQEVKVTPDEVKWPQKTNGMQIISFISLTCLYQNHVLVFLLKTGGKYPY